MITYDIVVVIWVEPVAYMVHKTYTVAVMRLRQAGFMNPVVSSGNFFLSPQLGLEPVPHTSKAQAERYLNGRQLIQGNYLIIQTIHAHPPAWLRGATKIKLKKVNKKRTVTVRRVIIFLNISRHPLLIWLHCFISTKLWRRWWRWRRR
jgi:hypothetical protein